MPATPILPKNASLRARQFLDFTGWQTPAPTASIQLALDFFLREVPHRVLFEELHDAGLWALPPGGPVYRLTCWMQAIDFSRVVRIRIVRPNERFKAFVRRHEEHGGNWFTFLSTEPEQVALPHNQDKARVYKAMTTFESLDSYVSDAYVDWARNEPVDRADPEYRHGGGRQFFIYRALRRHLLG